MSEGIATHSPAAVAIRASEMPPESARGSPMPPSWIAWKARMMPVTVPRSPSSGEMPAMVPSVLRKRSSSYTTCRPVSSRRSIRISRGRWRLARPVASSRPRGEFCSSAAMTLSLIWLASMSCHTFCGSSRGSTRLSCSVHSRSRIMAAAVIEHRMIGHISGPPARTISHIRKQPRLRGKTRDRHHTEGTLTLKKRPQVQCAVPHTVRDWGPCAHGPSAKVPRVDAAPAAEKDHSRAPGPTRALAAAHFRRTPRRSHALDPAPPRRDLRLRCRDRDLLRAAAGAPAAHHRGGAHLAAQHSRHLWDHLAVHQSLYRRTGLLHGLPRGRAHPAAPAAALSLRRGLALV